MTADKELIIHMAPEVLAQMDKDPEMAKVIREFNAVMHQAMDGVGSGKYASLDDALEILTGSRPEPINLEEK